MVNDLYGGRWITSSAPAVSEAVPVLGCLHGPDRREEVHGTYTLRLVLGGGQVSTLRPLDSVFENQNGYVQVGQRFESASQGSGNDLGRPRKTQNVQITS